MKQRKRIGLFLIGFAISCVGVYFMLFRGNIDRTYWLPENRLKDQMLNSKVIYSEHAMCIMFCRGITQDDVNEILKNGDVNFGESDVHNTPCPSYAFDGKTLKGKDVRVICTACDSIAEVTTTINLVQEKDTCKCK